MTEFPDRPIIQIDIQPRDLLDAAWELLVAANDPPDLFAVNGTVARLVSSGDGKSHRVVPLTKETLAGRLIALANWMRSERNSRPPDFLLRLMLDQASDRLPRLQSVVTVPVFDREAQLIYENGFHPNSGIFSSCPLESCWDATPVHPSPSDVAEARQILLDELLGDFPFATDSDRAHALAALLLPFVRLVISDGCTPLCLIESPSPGSGKSLLANVISTIVTGFPSNPITLDNVDGDLRKKLLSLLLSSPPVIVLDNLPVDRLLNSAVLASILTTTQWSDRVLGHSKMSTVLNHALWLATANNPILSMELTRRSVRIRLDARVDRPWLRDGFRHSNLVDWTRNHRAQIIRACLTLLQAWIDQGQPMYQGRFLGGFEDWSSTMGGILDTARVPGFLDNLEELYAAADRESEDWRELTQLWWQGFHATPVGISELLALCWQHDLLFDVIGNGNARSQSSRLGRALNRSEHMVFGNMRVVRDTRASRNSGRYLLENVE